MAIYIGNGEYEETADEEPRFQFRQQTVVPILFNLLRDQEITASDFLIITFIDSMVKPQGTRKDEKGLGCFAKNKYIGKGTNIHETYVSQRLSILSEKGYVLIVYHKKIRYLEIEWSRTTEERESLEGFYGKKLRKAHKKAVEIIKKRIEDKKKPNINEEKTSNNDHLCFSKGSPKTSKIKQKTDDPKEKPKGDPKEKPKGDPKEKPKGDPKEKPKPLSIRISTKSGKYEDNEKYEKKWEGGCRGEVEPIIDQIPPSTKKIKDKTSGVMGGGALWAAPQPYSV